MKQVKNFLVLIVLALFYSCANEMPIEGEGGEGPASGETAVTIQLPVEKVLTKGTDPETGLYATAKELEIQDCVIAIFGDNYRLAAYKRVAKGDADLVAPKDTDETKAYTIKNVDVPRGERMHILVIANSENVRSWDMSELTQFPAEIGETSFGDYYSLYETTPSFVNDRLVKIGFEDNVSITGIANEVVTVELTQLSARIDFRVLLSEELIRDGWSHKVNWLEKNNQRHISFLFQPEVPSALVETTNTPVRETYASPKVFQQHTFYTYEKEWYTEEALAGEHDALFVDVNLDLTKGEFTTNKTYRVLINPKGLGPNKNRHGLLHGNLYDIKARLTKAPNIDPDPEPEPEPGTDPVDLVLEYEIVSWWGNGAIEVNIPNFN